MKNKGLLVFCASIFAFSFALYTKKENPNKKDLDTNIVVRIKDSESIDKDEMTRRFFVELTNNISFNYRKVDEINGVFNFICLKVNSSDIEKINSLSTVEYAYEEFEYYFDPNDPTYNYLGKNEILITNYSENEMNKGEEIKDGENTIVAILDSALNYDHEAFQNINSSSIRYTSNDIATLANDSDFNGKNYKRINDKIPFSYDYCNDDNDVKAKDTHGSHVSSLSIGNGRYKGIAPQSQLAFMKVFNDYGGGCTSIVYLKALEDAYLLDVDAVNMSFGSALNYTKDATDKAVDDILNALREKGTQVFIAAGNDGRDDFVGSNYEYSLTSSVETGVMGNLALNEDSITVANSTLSDDVSNVYGLIDNIRSIQLIDRIVDSVGLEEGANDYHITDFPNEYRFSSLIGEGTYEYVLVPNKGADKDYKNINVKNKIAVVERGELPFTAKIYYAIKNGASGLIIYNQKSDTNLPQFSFKIDDETLENYPGIPTTIDEYGDRIFDLSYINIPVAIVTYEAGKRLNEASNKEISFFHEEMSGSSSLGANADLSLKPDLAAPGTNVYGAYSYYKPSGSPTSGNYYLNDAYYFLSGTSMASPNLMGAYISLLSSYNIENSSSREEAAKNIRNKIFSNTTLLKDEFGTFISPRRQGNGLINVDATYNSSSYLSYNDKNQMELGNSYTIRNGIFNEEVTLIEEETSHNYKITLNIMAPKIINDKFKDKDVELINSDDVLLESKVISTSYQSKVGENKIKIDEIISSSSREYLDRFENGTYIEGYLVFESEENSLNMPFLGFYGDYNSLKPYEDFSFEKDSNKVYESDIMDDYLRENYGLVNAYTGSYFLIGDNEKYYIRNILPSTFSLIKQYKYMEYIYDEENEIYHIYTGEYPDSKGLIIQLFMLRSVVDNEVTLFDSNNNVIETYYFKDSAPYNDLAHELHRSYILQQNSYLMNNEYFTHRSYCYIPLVYDDGYGDYLYPDGTYNFLFEFELVNGEKFTSKYVLHLGESFKSIPSIYDITLYNNILRVYVREQDSYKVLINNAANNSIKISNIGVYRSYFEINLNEYSSSDLFISVINNDKNSTFAKYFIDENVIIAGNEVSSSIKLEKEERNNKSYYLKLVDNNGELINFTNEVLYGLLLDGLFINVEAVDGESTAEINYQAATSENDLIRFNTSYSEFLINNRLESDGLFNLFLPSIIVVSIIAGGVLIVGTIGIIKHALKKRK